LRIAYMMLPGLQWDVQPVLLVVAVLTMLVGSVVAIVQADVKRMLAYSSIAHAGFLLIGVLAMDVTGVRGVLFYLLAYGLTTVAAFAVVTMVRVRADDGGIGGEATHLSQWAGLGRRSPLVAGLFTLLLLSFAGIPLTSGFIGKYGVFAAALAHFTTGVPFGGVIGVGVGVLASVIAAFFYVRVIVLMYFSEPVAETATVSLPGPMTAFAIALGVGGTILFGVYPSLVMDVAERLSLFLP
jgi:NADH-quinone oxidoreductase subunit N